ncbi:uncharacterized protein cubi_00877 [Cryptosporidium ubiquitum]|uniref:Uncharacterized protein n=1 Tax=Cryptosporidium ubiquitum TaxID=857276 RepID=A0A1J4MFC2_9CRYT|nr:uncharacterized protein cubi_00877 [Cryptosporidium ubiquitum]OII72905.1 hypothetical protein cubi_00877 [Cryptosporidium ubiquitum]
MGKKLLLGLLVVFMALLKRVESGTDYSGIFDPTSLLSKEQVNDALVDSWEKPIDIAESANYTTIFGDLLSVKTFSEVNSLFPLSPYNSVSDEVLIRCILSEGIVYSPETCPNLNCEQYPTSTDFKYYNSSSSSTIRVALSSENVILGSAIYTFDTSIIPSISLVNKFVVVFKIEDPILHSKISIRLVSVVRRGESGKEGIPILRGSSFHSIEQNIIPGKTFYSVDIVGLFNFLPNEFELSRVSIVVLPSSPSANVVLSMESYAIARFYMSVDTIPIYGSGGVGEKAIQQDKYIQVETTSVFGRSIIDYNDKVKARFNDYCPKTFGGQCLVQITSLKSTNAIGIFGFQLYLAGVVFAIKSAKIYIPISVFKSEEQVVTNIKVSLLKPNFSITKLNYEEFSKSFENPINSISLPLSLESGIKTLIVDITSLFKNSPTLAIENVLISISLPESYVGAIFTLNKAKITYKFDPSETFQSMDHLNTQVFSNPNIASIETSFFDKNGKAINFDSSLNFEDITQGNNTSISGNSAFVSQFSVPFITTESLQGMNITIVEKSKVSSNSESKSPSSSNPTSNSTTNSTSSKPTSNSTSSSTTNSTSNSTTNSTNTESTKEEGNNGSDLTVAYETLDYTISIVKALRITNLTSSSGLEVISSKDFKLNLGGVTRIDVMELVKKAISGSGLNLGLITFYGQPKSKESNQNLSLALPFMEIKWNPGSSLSNGVISGGSFETKLKSLKLGELNKTSWNSKSTEATAKLNSVALAAFDFSKIPCINTITSAEAKIEFSKFTANGEFEVFLMDKFDWNSSFTVESQTFFNNPIVKYTSDKSIPPTLLAVPFVADRKSSFAVDVSLTNVIGNGGVSNLKNPSLGVIAFSTNSDDSEMIIKSVEIDLKCSFSDGVYYNTAIV